MKEMKARSETEPQAVVVTRGWRCYYTTINFDIEVVDGMYEYESVTVKTEKQLCADDYPAVVSAIVRGRFSSDDVEAIQLNYLESKTTEHKNEFAKLKEWRAKAKAVAREVVGDEEG